MIRARVVLGAQECHRTRSRTGRAASEEEPRRPAPGGDALASLWSAKKVNPANSAAPRRARVGGDMDTLVTRLPAQRTRSITNAAPGTDQRTARCQQRAAERWDDDLPARTAIRADGLNARTPSRWPSENAGTRSGQAAVTERHDRDRAQGGGARSSVTGVTPTTGCSPASTGSARTWPSCRTRQEDRRERVHEADVGDRGAPACPRPPRGEHHGEQEDQVEDEPACLPGGERGERSPLGGDCGRRTRASRS